MTTTTDIIENKAANDDVEFINLDAALHVWTDEEVLLNAMKFFDRVTFKTQFIMDDDVVTHQVLHFICGDKVMSSAPQQLDWPMQLMDIPEEVKEDVKNQIN